MAKITIKIVDDDNETVVIKMNDDIVRDTAEAGLGSLIIAAVGRLEQAYQREINEEKERFLAMARRAEAFQNSDIGQALMNIFSNLHSTKHDLDHVNADSDAGDVSDGKLEDVAEREPEKATDVTVGAVNVANFGDGMGDEDPEITDDEYDEPTVVDGETKDERNARREREYDELDIEHVG